MKKTLLYALFFSNCILNGRILDYKNHIVDVLYNQCGITSPVAFAPIKEPHIYQITVDNQSYIVRLNEEYNIFARTIESALHIYAAEKGFGPKILFTDPAKQIIIMEKLEAPVVIPSNVDAFLPNLVNTLHLMHQTAITGRQIHKFTTNILNRVMNLNDMQRRDIHTIDIYASLLRLVNLFINETEVLVHGDLNPFNIFITKDTCKFIDFETPHVDTAFVDLAHVALCYGMNKEQEATLLHLYFNREIHTLDFIKLTAMKCFVCAKLICWMLESVSRCNNPQFPDILDLSLLQYTPPLHSFLVENPNMEDAQFRYKLAISAIKELEELLHQLDLCMMGNTSLIVPIEA
jgi:thiamine kinase-like enzyme